MTNHEELTFPIKSPALRRHCARELERCPQCGGCLDTGWECNDCMYDAMAEAYPPELRARDKKLGDKELL